MKFDCAAASLATGVALLCLILSPANSEALSSQFKADMTKSGIESCMRRQTAAAENEALTLGQINTFCKCFMKAQIEELTMEDVRTVRTNSMKIPPALERRLEEMSTSCAKDIEAQSR